MILAVIGIVTLILFTITVVISAMAELKAK